MKPGKTGLGRGLSALIDKFPSENEANESSPIPGGVLMADIRKIEPNPDQPRQYFNEEALYELAESMKSFGIVQPLLVKDAGDHYTIIAGERRYRAARMAKLTELPVLVKEYTEMETLQVALIENIQRQDLTSIEEAACYKKLMDEFFFSADEVASRLGKNKHSVISSLHLLELVPRAQELASKGKITASHAKVLLTVEDEDLQGACAEKIAEIGLSVRESETMVASVLKAAAKKAAETSAKLDEVSESILQAYRDAERELRIALGSQVRIIPGKKKSKIEIEYYSTDDLERLLNLLKKPPGINK